MYAVQRKVFFFFLTMLFPVSLFQNRLLEAHSAKITAEILVSKSKLSRFFIMNLHKYDIFVCENPLNMSVMLVWIALKYYSSVYLHR